MTSAGRSGWSKTTSEPMKPFVPAVVGILHANNSTLTPLTRLEIELSGTGIKYPKALWRYGTGLTLAYSSRIPQATRYVFLNSRFALTMAVRAVELERVLRGRTVLRSE
jgi:hypothetical protein